MFQCISRSVFLELGISCFLFFLHMFVFDYRALMDFNFPDQEGEADSDALPVVRLCNVGSPECVSSYRL